MIPLLLSPPVPRNKVAGRYAMDLPAKKSRQFTPDVVSSESGG
jgi:hypothetical protein